MSVFGSSRWVAKLCRNVQGDGLIDLRHHRRSMAGAIELAGRQRLPEIAPGKQPTPGPPRLSG
jgi:hypothetical protein